MHDSSQADFQFDLSTIEVRVENGRIQLTAYDADGNVSAVFDLKKDAGRVHMDANFADGVYLSITSIFGSVTVESNNAACVAERMRVRLPPHAAALHPYSKGIFTTIGAWAKAKAKVVSSHLERVAAQTSRVA